MALVVVVYRQKEDRRYRAKGYVYYLGIYDITTSKLVKTTKTLTAQEKRYPPGGCVHPNQLVQWLEEDFTLEGWE